MVAIEFIEKVRETSRDALEHMIERADKRESLSSGERLAVEDLITILEEIVEYDDTLKKWAKAKEKYNAQKVKGV